MQKLNELAAEVGAARIHLDRRSPSAPEFDRAMRLLERRCNEAALNARLRDITQEWRDNGGHLLTEVTELADLDAPATLDRHRVLKPNFTLKSRASFLRIRPVGCLSWSRQGTRKLEVRRPMSCEKARILCFCTVCSQSPNRQIRRGIRRGSGGDPLGILGGS